jgi:hypothetical protein
MDVDEHAAAGPPHCLRLHSRDRTVRRSEALFAGCYEATVALAAAPRAGRSGRSAPARATVSAAGQVSAYRNTPVSTNSLLGQLGRQRHGLCPRPDQHDVSGQAHCVSPRLFTEEYRTFRISALCQSTDLHGAAGSEL